MFYKQNFNFGFYFHNIYSFVSYFLFILISQISLATLKYILSIVIRPSETIRKQTITYLEETIKHRFIVSITAELLKIQKSGGVYLNVGKQSEGNQRKIKIVPILIGFALDNQEAFKIQSTRGSFKCLCSCRFCTMPNKEMYKFRVLHEILAEEQQLLL